MFGQVKKNFWCAYQLCIWVGIAFAILEPPRKFPYSYTFATVARADVCFLGREPIVVDLLTTLLILNRSRLIAKFPLSATGC